MSMFEMWMWCGSTVTVCNVNMEAHVSIYLPLAIINVWRCGCVWVCGETSRKREGNKERKKPGEDDNQVGRNNNVYPVPRITNANWTRTSQHNNLICNIYWIYTGYISIREGKITKYIVICMSSLPGYSATLYTCKRHFPTQIFSKKEKI